MPAIIVRVDVILVCLFLDVCFEAEEVAPPLDCDRSDGEDGGEHRWDGTLLLSMSVSCCGSWQERRRSFVIVFLVM